MATSPLQQMIRQAMRLHQRGELQRARDVYAKVLESAPQHPDALHLYGLACHQQGDHATAISYIRRAIEQVPDQPVLRNNLGDALCRAGKFEAAITQLQTALDLRPDYAGAHQNMSSAHAQMGAHDEALTHAKKAVRLDGDKPAAWFNLGLILLDHVLLEESTEAFRQALKLRPVYPEAATSLLYILNLLPGQDPGLVAEEHSKVATAAFMPTRPTPEFATADKRVRVGYVSGDFRTHAVSYFFQPVLEHHDRSEVEVYCYSDVARPDDVSRQLQQVSEHWRDISGWEDDRVLEKIRADRIDILVDLAGHTKHNRLGVFAGKAAPHQVTWLGFPNTTGLESVDYRIVDRYTAPGTENLDGAETPLRLLNGFACFRPPDDMPVVQAAPVEKNGFVTLGCLHKLEKLNTAVIVLWAQVLRENPQTRLLLARDQLDKWQQQRLQSLFLQHGITPDRLEMKQLHDPKHEFLDQFADIDILLDTFPWSGHTLACCALWMGVPVVTLKGDSHAGRMVAGVLDLMGLEELIAQNTEAYARVVNHLCNDQQRIVKYRYGLRGQFEKSPLRDEAGFTRDLESEYRSLIRS